MRQTRHSIKKAAFKPLFLIKNIDRKLCLSYNHSRYSKEVIMRILISYESGVPIYEQIKCELRGQILRGDLKPDEMLPSIRTLARELKIGIVTARRAYDDLCAEGFLYSVAGKGVFVAKFDSLKAEEFAVGEIRRRLEEIAAFAARNSVDGEVINQLIKEVWGK